MRYGIFSALWVVACGNSREEPRLVPAPEAEAEPEIVTDPDTDPGTADPPSAYTERVPGCPPAWDVPPAPVAGCTSLRLTTDLLVPDVLYSLTQVYD